MGKVGEKFQHFISANIPHIVNRKWVKNHEGLGVMHYALAYRAMYEYHPEFCEAYLVKPEEFLRRTERLRNTHGYFYLPILKDLSVSGMTHLEP